MEYRHLTEGERYQIEALSKVKKSPAAIADQLRRPKCTISRELERNGGQQNYRAAEAQLRFARPVADVVEFQFAEVDLLFAVHDAAPAAAGADAAGTTGAASPFLAAFGLASLTLRLNS